MRSCAFSHQSSDIILALNRRDFGVGARVASASLFDPAAALIPALFSVWHNVSAPALATDRVAGPFIRRSRRRP